MDEQIKHDRENQEFSIALEEEHAELAYALPGDQVIDFQHTFVPVANRRKGIAGQLIKAGLDYAKENKMKVIASCPAVAAYIRKNQEYQPLLKSPQ